MPSVPANPNAPPCYNGVNPDTPEGYVDLDFGYPYDVTLTANQVLQDDSVSITTDADFVARAIVIAFATSNLFKIRLSDSQGNYLSNGLIYAANLVGDASSPYPILPELLIPAGGRIGIDITDLSGSNNTIEILFRGVKRYRVA